ncbi:hypothetical protein M2103_001645 [Ereboglobus sp. PH5-5]|nr:hypothetical protein [Ereboglobus sp. PH5-10]MDF9833421.1 hypothetical protein [Ereboglobus sp. PH5-5]
MRGRNPKQYRNQTLTARARIITVFGFKISNIQANTLPTPPIFST